MPGPLDILRRVLTLRSHRMLTLPVLVLSPHSRCNCRCVMCDIWRANANRRELGEDDLRPHVEALRRLRVRRVALTGGEALMHSNLWALTRLLAPLGVRISLLSTGLLLRRHAAEIVREVDEVIVSLDGPAPVHDAIREVPRAFAKLADGVAALREVDPDFPVHGRSVVQRRNFRALDGTLAAARELGLDSLSFLAADVSSTAFNRPDGWDAPRTADVALSAEEAHELGDRVEAFLAEHGAAVEAGYVVESPEKLRRIAGHFLALAGEGGISAPLCNAPWVSAVVEVDGAVRPCFFHPPIGHLDDGPLDAVLDAPRAREFRRRLDVASDPVCARCTCSLHLSPRADP